MKFTHFRLGRLLVAVGATVLFGSATLLAQVTVIHNASGGLSEVRTGSAPSPQILAEPANRLASAGQNAAFSVLSTGAAPLRYLWLFNSNLLAGATSDSLLVTNVTLSDFGAYQVVVANAFGSVTSTVARLELDSDGDGLADRWEITYFGSVTNQNAAMDRDNDGVSNLAEFREGSNPTNATSYLPRLTVRVVQGTLLVVPDLEHYTNGQSVTVSATPNSGLSFIAWTGARTTNASTVTVVMNSNITLLATCGLPLAPALNVESSVATGGDAAWYGQTGESADGVSAARSGTIGHNQKSWLQITNQMNSQGTVGFQWRVSSQFGYDFLSVYVNNVLQLASISGEKNWHQRTYYLTSGVNVVRWEYAKNAHDGYESDGITLYSTRSGDNAYFTGNYLEPEDAAFLDQVQFEEYPDPSLDSDHNGLPDLFEYKYFFEIGGDPTADPDLDGVTNAEEAGDGTNPTLSNSARPRVRIAIEGAGSVLRQPDLPSYRQYNNMTNTATAANGGSFVAWVGNVNFAFAFAVKTNNPLVVYLDVTKSFRAVFGMPLGEVTDIPALPWTKGGEVGWYGQTHVTHDGISAARSGPLGPLYSESWMETAVVGPGSLSFWWKVDSTTNVDELTFLINSTQQPAKISGVVDWQPQAYYLAAGTNTLRWRFKRNGGADTNRLTAGWVDQVVFKSGATVPVFVQQPVDLSVLQTSNALVRVLASGTPTMSYQLFRGSVPYGAATPSSLLIISNVSPTQSGAWTVRASNSAGDTASDSFSLSVLPVPPLNDRFASRQPLIGLSNAISGYNFGATKEPGEPAHGNSEGGRSVWYSWTAPQTAKYLAIAEDRQATGPLLLGVYQGNFVTALATAGSASDSGTFTDGGIVVRAKALFSATAGTRYAIAVDTDYGLGTWFTLAMELIPPPPNDAFANRIFITGSSVTVYGKNLAATREFGEPSSGFLDGSNSVWWAWTAPSSGTAIATWTGSSFAPIVSIFTGNTLTTLDIVTNSFFTGMDSVRFPVAQGVRYSISVDGLYGSAGDIVLNLATLAPSISASIDPATGDPVLKLSGAADLAYVIQGSTNLIHWRSVATNRVPRDGVILLPAALTTNGSSRFFRAFLP